MLDKLLNESTILLKQSAEDWREAIEIAGSLLVKTGKITEEYIGEVINAVYEMGPYMVIMPGVALAHARPSQSVLDQGISMVTLTKPVVFGHETNDPVYIIFEIAATENTGHITALQNLAILLSDESTIDLFKCSNDINLILNKIKEVS